MKIKIANGYWIHSGFFTILKNISSILLSFGGFFFLVRVLDKNSFGVWSLFLGTTTLMEFARNGLVVNAFIKYLSSSEKEDYPKIISASFAVTAILTFICIIINCCIAKWLSSLWHAPEVVNLFYLYNIVFVLTGIINQFNSIQQANLKFKGIFYSSLSGSVIGFAYIAGSYFFTLPITLLSLMYIQILGAIAALFISYFNTRNFIVIAGKIDKQWVKDLLGYGKFSFGTIISAMIFNSIDQWMLGYLISPTAAGSYNIASRITSLVEVPTGTIATIVFPQSAKRMAAEGKGAAKYLYEKSVGTILALLIPGFIFLFLFSGFVVKVIAGIQYADSIPILRVTLLYCLLIPYGRQFGTILDSIGKPKINFYIVIISALSNIGLNYFFIHRYGIIGAAYGTLSASIINFLLGQFVLKKLLQVNLPNTFKYAIGFYPEFIKKYLIASPKILPYKATGLDSAVLPENNTIL